MGTPKGQAMGVDMKEEIVPAHCTQCPGDENKHTVQPCAELRGGQREAVHV